MSSIAQETIEGLVSDEELAQADELMTLVMNVKLEVSRNHIIIGIDQPFSMAKLTQQFYLDNGEVVNDELMRKPEQIETNVELCALYDLADRLYGIEGVASGQMVISDYEMHFMIGRAFDPEIVISQVLRVIAAYVQVDLENVFIEATLGSSTLSVPYAKFLKSAGTTPVDKLTKKQREQLEDIILKMSRSKKGAPVAHSMYDMLAGGGAFSMGL